MAINALVSDRNLARGLELTLEDMFMDPVRRREKGGKCSRSMAPAVSGFIHITCEHINGSIPPMSGRTISG